jgi:hypothetical protein
VTQPDTAEPLRIEIVACEACDQLFLVSPRRQTCPTCAGNAGVSLFQFDVAADGVHLLGGLVPEAAQAAAAPAAAPAPEAPSGIPEISSTAEAQPAEPPEPGRAFAGLVARLLTDAGAPTAAIAEFLYPRGIDGEIIAAAEGCVSRLRHVIACVRSSEMVADLQAAGANGSPAPEAAPARSSSRRRRS